MIGQSWVVDASVAIKWIVEEADSDLARTLEGRDLVAPHLLRLECLSAIWRRILKGQLGAFEIPEALRLLDALPIQLRAIDHHLDEVLRLSVLLAHPIYDCVYLVLALASGSRVVTADRRFREAVRRKSGLEDRVVLLSELAH